MEKHNIALISDWYFPKVGGIEYSMHALAKTLNQQGHEVHVLPEATRLSLDTVSGTESQ